ncbi:TRM11 family SAM-dependent methyltransferase [Patescibacteria group bacterium]
MHKYVFILGRKWMLAAAEIKAVFGDAFVTAFNEFAICEFDKPLKDPQIVLDKLGGTIKIGEIVDEVPGVKHLDSAIIDYLSSVRDGKIQFAISLYNMTDGYKNTLKKLLRNVKDGLRESGSGKVRFYNKPDQNIKSVVIHEENLAQKGTDISVMRDSGRHYIARTVAVQNFKKYSIRDYDRPAKDAKSGMLPPKLAQIMINLACKGRDDAVIYDPFCGSGTVLMEGALMGHKVIGSDISNKAILDSQKNLKWLSEQFKVDLGLVRNIFVKDATKVVLEDLPERPDFIVGETYLGPPLFKLPSPDEIKKNFSEIEGIVLGSLKQFKNIAAKGGSIVLAVPFYRYRGGKHFLDNLVEKAGELGIVVDNLPNGSKRGSLLYDRKDQVVGREIFRFKIS